MPKHVCEFTVRYVPLPREQRVAYQRGIDLLAGWLLEESIDDAVAEDWALEGFEQAEMATVSFDTSLLTTSQAG